MIGTNLVTSTGARGTMLRTTGVTEAVFKVHFYFLFVLLEPCHFK